MIAKLEIDLYNTLKWFDSNFMVANPTKFQVMFLGLKKNQNLVSGEAITTSKEVKLLGVTIDSKLNFNPNPYGLFSSYHLWGGEFFPPPLKTALA